MLLEYGAKFLAGGLFVCMFALISQICQPKQFAGIFSAAPSVLLAGLAITLVTEGTSNAVLTAQGAIAGAVGMMFYCLTIDSQIKQRKTIVGSFLSLVWWSFGSLCAFALMSIVLRW